MAPVKSAVRVATWNCFQHGHKDVWCCERAILIYSLPRDQTLGAVPWLRRSEVRHELQVLHSECLEIRNWMVKEHGSVATTVRELDRMIGTLEHCKRMITGRRLPR